MISIICAGSRGDFQPYIALAQELKKLGQNVRIVGFSEHRNFINGYGIDCTPIEVDYEKIGVDKRLISQAASADNPAKMLFAFQKMKKYAIHIARQTYEALEGSDLIIYHPGSTIGYFAAHEMGIPAILASPFPMHKTNEYLSVVSYGRKAPTGLNKRLSYEMLQRMLWMASGYTVKEYWKQRFHKIPSNFGAPYERVSEREPAFISCSNFVFQRPHDWNNNIHQYGYWFVEETKEYNPSREVVDFLSKGAKPVYIGFGSVFNSDDKDWIVRLIIDALAKTGQRGIISGMGQIENLPKRVIAVGSMPHSWLFRQCSAVCHHGGAGTTAAGFKTGIPSIIIPFSNDQFAWAYRAYDLGVGVKPIYKTKLTSDRLANAISEALRSDISSNAKKLGANIASENGAKECAKIISSL